MWCSIAAFEILEQCEHLVPAGGEELPDVVLPHVVSEVAPGLLSSLMLHLKYHIEHFV